MREHDRDHASDAGATVARTPRDRFEPLEGDMPPSRQHAPCTDRDGDEEPRDAVAMLDRHLARAGAPAAAGACW